MADGLETGDLGPSLHVRDVAGGEKACCPVSDGLAAADLGLRGNVRDAAGGEKVSQEEFRACKKGFRYAETYTERKKRGYNRC